MTASAISITAKAAVDIVDQIAQGMISCEEVMLAFLENVEKHNTSINAIVCLRTKEELLEEARAKDKLAKAGKAEGKLFGLPMTVKDTYWVKDLINTNGHPSYTKQVATEDAELVKRIKREGAIIIGKTNLPIFSFDWQSVNSWYGRTNNPYDANRVPGGSSGGSAASVAAQFSPLELGSDAGGSIRIPAGFCGIYGLRPTEGALSNAGNAKFFNRPRGGRHIIVPGPMAKNMEDLELLLKVLWGEKNDLPEVPSVPYTISNWSGEKLKIAYSDNMNGISIDEDILEVFNQFIYKLKKSEHSIREESVRFPEKEAYHTHTSIFGKELDIGLPKYLPFKKLGVYLYFALRFRDHAMGKGLASGIRISAKNFAKALEFKDYYSSLYTKFLTVHDVWITPLCAVLPFTHRKTGTPFQTNGRKVRYTDALGRYTFTSALSGHPILAMPIGNTKEGLPVAIQVHVKKWSDRKLVQIGKFLASLTEGYTPPVILSSD